MGMNDHIERCWLRGSEKSSCSKLTGYLLYVWLMAMDLQHPSPMAALRSQHRWSISIHMEYPFKIKSLEMCNSPSSHNATCPNCGRLLSSKSSGMPYKCKLD